MSFSLSIIYICLITELMSQSLTNFELITDPLMTYDGRAFGLYINETKKEIWLFSLDIFNISLIQ